MNHKKFYSAGCVIFLTSMLTIPASYALDAKTYAKLGRLKVQYRDSESLVDNNGKDVRSNFDGCGNQNIGTLKSPHARNTKIEVFVDGDVVNASKCR